MHLLFLGGGLWIIPLLTLAGSVIFLVGSLKVRKAGYEERDPNTGKYHKIDEKPPIYKSGRFIFSMALLVNDDMNGPALLR